eukprot:jgi/Astpho2/5357/fgenesh1_pg.00075_%23_32_t
MYARPTSHAEALGPGCAGPTLALPYPTEQSAGPSSLTPSCGAAPFTVDPSAVASANAGNVPRKHTQSPYVTGTSVLAVTYKDGVLVASDTLGSYGSTKRYKSFERLRKVNSRTVIGAGGELSDFQYIMTLLDELATEDFLSDDGIELSPREVFAYLTRVLYNRRNKFDPLWNSLVVCGLQPEADSSQKPFIGFVGMIGTHYEDVNVATGFGNQLARPLFREKHRPDMSEEEAANLIKEALRVCYYRDKQSINKFQMASVKAADGGSRVTISEPFALDTKWDYKAFIDPSANATGTW